MSGLIADSRTMVDRARVQAQNHWFMYNEPMSVESVTQSVSNLAMAFGKDSDDDNKMVISLTCRFFRGGAWGQIAESCFAPP